MFPRDIVSKTTLCMRDTCDLSLIRQLIAGSGFSLLRGLRLEELMANASGKKRWVASKKPTDCR